MSAALLAVAWLVLAGGDLGSWPVGTVTVALALWVIRVFPLPSTRSIRIAGVARFVVYFLVESLISGMHVARRALEPRLSLDPGLVRYESRLSDESCLVFLANAISMLPGTLTCGLEGSTLTVHVLDQRAYRPQELRQLEDRVAALFGVGAGAERNGGPP